MDLVFLGTRNRVLTLNLQNCDRVCSEDQEQAQRRDQERVSSCTSVQELSLHCQVIQHHSHVCKGSVILPKRNQIKM